MKGPFMSRSPAASEAPETQSCPDPTSPPPKVIPAHQWSYSDPPAAHEYWAKQVELERAMLKAGADTFRDRVIEAKAKGQFTRLHPVRNLLVDWLPSVARGIKEWVKATEKVRGVKPIALPYVKALDPEAAAAITIRIMLDSLTKEHQKLVGAAMQVGRTIEYEQRVRYWEATEPDLFYHYKNEMDRNKSTATHRHRVNINRFNHLLEHAEEEGLSLEWDAWSEEVKFRVGIALIDAVIHTTGWFHVVADPNFTFRKGRVNRPQYVLTPKPGLLAWMGSTLDDAELAGPEFKPTIMPPKRWTGSRGGGYWTPYVNAPRLVRFKASQEDQRKGAADEYDAFEMDAVYDALHTMQETPYRINGEVLDVVLKCWQMDREIGKLPRVAEQELPPRTPRMEEHAEASREARAAGLPKPEMDEATRAEVAEWKRKATPIHRFNAKRASRLRSASSTVRIAMEYREYEAIYFPHMLDFRGRIYPIPNFLQPQGDDLARGLLTFAEGLPIEEGSGGDGWLAIHLASTWGNDKVSYEERIDWVVDREATWRAIAADPIDNMDWADADKPWQALAAVFEWVRFLDEGYGYVSNLPVMVDGTCNGIQHLAALTRDEVTAKYVNLIPGDKPEDIYKFVASDLQETLDNIMAGGGAEGAKAEYWLALTGYDLPRSLTKRQVMVLPYGATKDAFYRYTRQWLDAEDPIVPLPADATDEERKAAWDLRNGRVSFLVGHLWDSVQRTVRGGMQVMQWLQDCAKVAAVDDQPIYWVTPSGFVVRHFYGLDRMVRCKILLDGERYTLSRAERTAKLSVKEQLQGISPNFIHSLDAAALVKCLIKARAGGVRSVMTVHDAYGTHAANMWPLSRFIRDAFVEVHEVDNLGNFRASCQRVLVDNLVTARGMDPFAASQMADEMLPPPLDMGNLDLQAVRESDYFFA